MDNYAEQVKKQNTLTYRSLSKNMPAFCVEFLRGISKSVAPRSLTAYARDLLQFMQYIVDHNPEYKNKTIKDIPFEILEMLHPSDFADYMEYLTYYVKDGVEYTNENASIARKITTLNKLFEFYIKRKELTNNPITAIDRPKLTEKAIISLNQEQIDRLLHVVNNPIGYSDRQKKFHDLTVIRDQAIIVVLLGTGMRVSELVGLDITDIDFAASSFKITRKGGNQRYIYFGEAVYTALSRYLDEENCEGNLEAEVQHLSPRDKLLKKRNDEKALFLSLRGSRLTVRSVEVLVKKYGEMLNINKTISPHKLRSTYGTHAYNSSGDIYLTSELMGHKSISTTVRFYSSMSTDALRGAKDIMQLKLNND